MRTSVIAACDGLSAKALGTSRRRRHIYRCVYAKKYLRGAQRILDFQKLTVSRHVFRSFRRSACRDSDGSRSISTRNTAETEHVELGSESDRLKLLNDE